MKGAFVTNRYYSDSGTEYVYSSLKRAFGSRVNLEKVSPTLVYDRQISLYNFDYDFAIFWSKDLHLAAAIQKTGIRVFNPPKTIDICDDKQKTYLAISEIDIPKTISSPQMYDVCDDFDHEFLKTVVQLGFPMIIKQNIGSQGRQVYLAKNKNELQEIYQKLRHIPHHYQELIGKFGSDIRIYTVGGKVVGVCKRLGTDYRSNLAAGGQMELINPSKDYLDAAISISKQLNLDFGAVDFLVADRPIFLEVNSNAYFTGIEALGVDIAGQIASYIISEMKNSLGQDINA